MDRNTGIDLQGSGAEPLAEEDPRRIGPIPLIGRLGAGGMGRVFLGVHDGRYVAVKQVLPSIAREDEDFLLRFGHELDNLARLPEDATARLIAGDRAARLPWFATAYVPGITLREAVESHGPLPAEALWLLLREAADGLAAIHALDMVHRDVKPSNAMLTPDGLTLIDFGVAHAAQQSRLTSVGMVVGTAAYMSPEQAQGKRALSGAVDIFALGSMVAYAATGTPPFGDESGPGVLYRIVHEDPDLQQLRDLDGELADVVADCLAKAPEGRPTAAELVERTSGRGPAVPPLWPEPIAEKLSERAAFAARTPDLSRFTAPNTTRPDTSDGENSKDTFGPTARAPEGVREGAESGAGPAVVEPKPTAAPKERRRTRIRPVIIPVLVSGGVGLTAVLLPHVTEAGDGHGRGPSSSVTAPVVVSPSVSADGPEKPPPSGDASASKKPKKPGESESGHPAMPGAPDGDQAAGGSVQGADGGGGGGNGDSGTSGGGGNGGSGTSGGGGGGSSGSGTSGSGGGSDGSATGSSGGSGGSSTTGGGTSPVPGRTLVRNVGDGRCVVAQSFNVWAGSCTGDAAVWKLESLGSGTYRLVSKSSGNCMTNGPAQLSACGTERQGWRLGAGGTLVSTRTGDCLEATSYGQLFVRDCTGAATQRWSLS